LNYNYEISKPADDQGRFFRFMFLQCVNFYSVLQLFTIQQQYRSKMIHRNFLATILTVLLVGTISITILSYNNSGLEISIFSTYNYAYAYAYAADADAADKTQTDRADDLNGSAKSNDGVTSSSVSDIENLQHKLRELMLEANDAKIGSAKANNAAGNATEEARTLSSIADEADTDAKRLLKTMGVADKQLEVNRNETNAQVQNSNNNNENEKLNAALSEAKEKRKAANLAEKDASELSDRANSLTEAANRAEKLVKAAQKELEHAISGSGINFRKSNSNGIDSNENANANANTNLKNDGLDVFGARDNSNNRNRGVADGEQEQEQMGIRTTTNNNSVSRNQEQFRNGLPEVAIPPLNDSTSADITFKQREINKQIDNTTATNYNSNNDNPLDVNPFNNSSNDDGTIASISQTSNDTVEFEGNINCKVRLDIATTTTAATTIDGEDGGCYPQSSESGRYQYVVWSEGDEDNRFILFKRSVNNKVVEDAITLSGNIPSAAFNPKVTSLGSNVYVVWQGDSDSGNQDILMRKSNNYGESFGDVINLSNDRAGSGNPEINVNSSNVYVVWDGTTPSNNDIYFRKSVNNGTNFDKVKNLSTNNGVSYEPKVVLDKKGVQIYWRDYRDGQEEILARKSLNEGRTFEVLKNIDKDVLDLWKDRGGGRDRLSN
jgi:hypothetical protein